MACLACGVPLFVRPRRRRSEFIRSLRDRYPIEEHEGGKWIPHGCEVIMNAFIPIWARRLKNERHERCWSQKDMVRRLVEVAAEHANVRLPSRESLARMLREWESGRTHPRLPYPRLLALAFGLTEAELFGQPDISENGSGEPRERILEAKASARDEDDEMKRRRLMRDAAAVAVGGTVAPVLATLTDAWQASEAHIPGASVSRAMIDDWEDAADIHTRRAYVDSPAVVLAGLAADFADMAPHLSRSQPKPVERDMAHAAARHAALIAGKWFDLGHHREAHRWWRKTRTLSERSGDALLAAWLIGWEAGYRRQDPSEDLNAVLVVAREARRLAGDRPSLPLADNLGSEAQILAMLGRHEEAVAVWRLTEEAFDRLPSGVNAPDPGSMHYARSVIYTFAGDVKRATDAQNAATSLYRPEHRTATLLALHNAALHARTDPAQGAQRASRIMEKLPSDRRDTRVKAAARMVLGAIPDSARTLPAVREFCALTSGGRSV